MIIYFCLFAVEVSRGEASASVEHSGKRTNGGEHRVVFQCVCKSSCLLSINCPAIRVHERKIHTRIVIQPIFVGDTCTNWLMTLGERKNELI